MGRWTCRLKPEHATTLKRYIENMFEYEFKEKEFNLDWTPYKDRYTHSGNCLWDADTIMEVTSNPSKFDRAAVDVSYVRIDGKFHIDIGFGICHYFGEISPYNMIGSLCLTPKEARQLITVLTEVENYYNELERK